ncbi:MAG: DUF2130 domain-containing protein [Phycisphaerae bacterium]|nr:DUF2130 domain-containing protein [Phycisphaerae bacterium]
MSDQTIKCPKCGTKIPLSEALTSQIEDSIRAQYEAELAKKSQELEKEKQMLKKQQEELEKQRQSIDEKVTELLKVERKNIAEQEKAKILAEQSEQTKALEQELEEKRKQILEANKKELELRKQQQKLEEEKAAIELTVQRQIDEERKKISEEAGKKATEEQQFKMREKDDLIKSMQGQIENLKRRAEAGSQEAQGEAMEGALKDILQQTFPFDRIEEVKKGQRGADVVQTVRNTTGKECGKILWEAKNTQAFNKDWIEKLKKDQQEEQAELAVITTITLPKEIKGFGIVKDVWITDYQTAICLATALRYGLINVAREKLVVTNQSTVKDIVYRYVTGQEFNLQIKSIVTAFGRMKDDLESERRAMQKYWKSREKQIETVLDGMSNIYGAIEGYVGQKQLPQIDPLLLDTMSEDEESV